jgi:hypothetical protein
MHPVYCNSSDPNGFTKLACWRLNQNLMGEAQFFREGMSIGDLMYTYSSELAFTKIDSWSNGLGFCFHSDHALGYFFGFYHIAVPEDKLNLATSSYEGLRREYGYTGLAADGVECKNKRRKCNSQSRICHYVKPFMMDRLFAETKNVDTS